MYIHCSGHVNKCEQYKYVHVGASYNWLLAMMVKILLWSKGVCEMVWWRANRVVGVRREGGWVGCHTNWYTINRSICTQSRYVQAKEI